jgi:hypothetical protein
LRDAAALYKAGSYASSIAIAALAREGLDRAIVLRGLRDRVLSGCRLSLPEINEDFGDQENEEVLVHAGNHLGVEPDPRHDDVTRMPLSIARRSQGHRQADLFAEQARKEQAERTRKERRALRIGCLYVRPDSVLRPKSSGSE